MKAARFSLSTKVLLVLWALPIMLNVGMSVYMSNFVERPTVLENCVREGPLDCLPLVKEDFYAYYIFIYSIPVFFISSIWLLIKIIVYFFKRRKGTKLN